MPSCLSTSVLENRIILFVGGGSGGHIFPNLAVMERLDERRVDFASHFVVSQRPLDAAILTARHLSFTALPVAPLTWRPWRWPAFSPLATAAATASVARRSYGSSGPRTTASETAQTNIIVL